MDNKFIFVFIEMGKFILWEKFELFLTYAIFKRSAGAGGGGGGGSHIKVKGINSKCLEGSPKRYQNSVLRA